MIYNKFDDQSINKLIDESYEKLIDESYDKYYPKIIYNKSVNYDDIRSIDIRLEYKTFIIQGYYYYKTRRFQISYILIKKISKFFHRKTYKKHELDNYVHLNENTKIVKELEKNLPPQKQQNTTIQDIFKTEDEYQRNIKC